MPNEQSHLISDTSADTTIAINTTEEENSQNPCYVYALADTASIVAFGVFGMVSASIGGGIGIAVNKAAEWLAPCVTCVGTDIVFRAAFTAGWSGGLAASLAATTKVKDEFLQRRGDECGTSNFAYFTIGSGMWSGLGFTVLGAIVAGTTNITYTTPVGAIYGAGAATAAYLITTALTAPDNVVTAGRRWWGLYERNPEASNQERMHSGEEYTSTSRPSRG